MKSVLSLLLLMLPACRTRSPQPVDIEPAEMCAFCRMAISQLQYAAEMIDAEEQVFKFDDIGCMVRFSRARKRDGAVWFVMDYDSRKWLTAADAHLVKSPSIQSPMGGGIIALEDGTKAQDYARQFHGKVVGFRDLWQQ